MSTSTYQARLEMDRNGTTAMNYSRFEDAETMALAWVQSASDASIWLYPANSAPPLVVQVLTHQDVIPRAQDIE